MQVDKIFMDKVYHIYVKNECVYHSLTKEKFKELWDFVQKITWITEIHEDDIQYEEVSIDKEFSLNSSY